MARSIYVNGQYLPGHLASVSCEDRGFQFGDGVYEGIELAAGHLIDLKRHLDRLNRSMNEIRMIKQPSMAQLRHIIRETVRRNRCQNGFVYLQITRGVAPRDYRFPPAETAPSIVCIVYHAPAGRGDTLAEAGIKVITMPDIRWTRPDIKSLQLLPGVLARQQAFEAGASEAWLLDESNHITEGAASNAWIVTEDKRLITRHTGTGILAGITRQTLADLLHQEDLLLEERSFHIDEALKAREAFITSSTNTLMPVIKIDGKKIGSGKPGPLTLRLRQSYRQYAPKER
jgi:D-alanine transaminase